MADIFEFDKICRICAMNGVLLSIFSDTIISYSDMIMAVADVQIMKDDGFPSHICVKCTATLESAYLFRQKAQETDAKFRSSEIEVYVEIKEEHHVGEGQVHEKLCTVNLENVNPILNNDIESEELSNPKRRLKIKKKKRNDIGINVGITKCNICEKTFKSSYKLRGHMHTHTKPFCCEYCSTGFSSPWNLLRHKKIHTGERPYKCDVCGKGFIQLTTLQSHQLVHTGQRPYKCLLCDKGFVSRQGLNVHVSVHNPKKTRGRGRPITELNQPNDFKSNPPVQLIQNDDVILYSCNLCKRNFVSKSGLKTHYLSHGAKNFLCNYCGKDFTSKTGLNSHIKIHTGEKPFACSVCAKAFSHQAMLENHKRIHTGERPFVCTLCNSSFIQSTHLQYHLRVHTGEKPYKCSVCKKRFSLKGTLTVHMRIHTGEKPYVCSVCDKGFYHLTTMKKHRARHTILVRQSKMTEN